MSKHKPITEAKASVYVLSDRVTSEPMYILATTVRLNKSNHTFTGVAPVDVSWEFERQMRPSVREPGTQMNFSLTERGRFNFGSSSFVLYDGKGTRHYIHNWCDSHTYYDYDTQERKRFPGDPDAYEFELSQSDACNKYSELYVKIHL